MIRDNTRSRSAGGTTPSCSTVTPLRQVRTGCLDATLFATKSAAPG
jgi:hypothetical protein